MERKARKVARVSDTLNTGAEKGPGLSLPGPDQRIAIVGSTGSGKTVAGLWQLSLRDYDKRPWIVIDFKGDELINQIEHRKYLSIDSELPRLPGIYVMRPKAHDPLLADFFMDVWNMGGIGIFIDELFMVKASEGFQAILTQGRSLHIPMIMLTQRPRRVPPFSLTENEFTQVFRLGRYDDRKEMETVLPDELYSAKIPLERYHSVYYNAPDQVGARLGPVDPSTILPRFSVRLAELERKLQPLDSERSFKNPAASPIVRL